MLLFKRQTLDWQTCVVVIIVVFNFSSCEARGFGRRQNPKTLALAEQEQDVQVVPRSESSSVVSSSENQHSSESIVMAGKEKEPTTPKPSTDIYRVQPRTRLTSRQRALCDSEMINPAEKRLGRENTQKSANLEENPKSRMETLDQDAEILAPDRKLKKSERMRRLEDVSETKSSVEDETILPKTQPSEMENADVAEVGPVTNVEEQQPENKDIKTPAVEVTPTKRRRTSLKKSRKTTTTTTTPPPPEESNESISDETHEAEELEYPNLELEHPSEPEDHEVSSEDVHLEEPTDPPVAKPMEEEIPEVKAAERPASAEHAPASEEHTLTSGETTPSSKSKKGRKRKSKRRERTEEYSDYRQARRQRVTSDNESR